MKQKSLESAKAIENPPGIVRRTLAYNDQAMLCHFELKKGTSIPLHDHPPDANRVRRQWPRTVHRQSPWRIPED